VQTSDWKPAPNYLLVAVPERFEQQHQPGKPRLFLPSGSDDWAALDAQIRLGVGAEIETDEVPIPVRQGLVLAVPSRLTDDMVLCAGPHSTLVPLQEAVIVHGKTIPDPATGGRMLRSTGKLVEQNIPRTAADITQQVQVGDTIHFDFEALTDEAEVTPGVYLIGYADVIAILATPKLDPWHEDYPYGPVPICGYVLLKRVWPEGVRQVNADEYGLEYTKSDIVSQLDVPPLPNEGIVLWHSSPLRGTRQQAHVGDHVIVDVRHTRVETIAGTEYLCVRQDYLLAVRQPMILPSNLLQQFKGSTLENITQDEIDSICNTNTIMPVIMKGLHINANFAKLSDADKEVCLLPYAIVMADKTLAGRNTLRMVSWEQAFQIVVELMPSVKFEKPSTIGGYSDTLHMVTSVFTKYI